MSTKSKSDLSDPSLPLANPWLAILLAWLFPGAGHIYLGRRGRGLFFAALIIGTLVFGLSIGGHLPWQFSGSPLFILASLGALGSGVPVLIAKALGISGELSGAGFEYGRAFVITAGLMNWMLVLDTWDIAWGKELEEPSETGDEEESPDGEEAEA